MSVLLGVFDLPGQIAAAVTQLRARGYTDIETYAPAPFGEVDDAVDEKPSRVRLFTLLGGLTGVVAGFAMTIWMANDWQIMLGGKPYASIPPYTIIAFELTILFGGLLMPQSRFLSLLRRLAHRSAGRVGRWRRGAIRSASWSSCVPARRRRRCAGMTAAGRQAR